MKNLFRGIIETGLLVILISGCVSNVQANDVLEDLVGPGVNMIEKDYNGYNGIIYTFGIGPVVEENTENVSHQYQEPITVESTIVNPIDNSTIDMGPTSANNTNYTLHFINDGGPGMGVSSNANGSATVYNDNGPGMEVMALTDTEDVYVDNGPTAVESTADPRNFFQMLLDLIPTKGEGIFRSYKKNAELSSGDTKTNSISTTK